MNNLKKNTNNSIATIFCVVLVFFILFFASSEKSESLYSPNSSICLFIDTHSSTQAVIPASTDLPICTSFTDNNHIIINQSLTSNYSINLKIDNEFSSAQKKHLLIKPLFNKVVRRITFPDPKSTDFIAIC